MITFTTTDATNLTPSILGIDHPCLVRKSERIYHLLDHEHPDGEIALDVGQIKEFVLFDRHLRLGGKLRAVPAGYKLFAILFNAHHLGPERFTTFDIANGMPRITTDGEGVVWNHFMIEDSLVGWNRINDLSTSGVEGFVVVNSDRAASQKKEVENMVGKMKERIKFLHSLNAFYKAKALFESRFAHGLIEISNTVNGMTGEIKTENDRQLRDAMDVLCLETKKQAEHHSGDGSKLYDEFIAGIVSKITESEEFLNEKLQPAISSFDLDLDEQDEKETEREQLFNTLRQSFQRLEAIQLNFLKDSLWNYANLLSTSCVHDDDSAENLRLVLERFDPPVQDADCPDDTTPTATPKITAARLPRLEDPVPSPSSTEYSRPLPQIAQTGNIAARPTFFKPVLFYVKALYDYTATIPEEFDFKAGDMIAVTKVSKSGWWTGEPPNLAEDPEKSGKRIFPSNYVTIL